MITALGYLVLKFRHLIISLLGDIFFSLWHAIRYRSDSSQHLAHDNHLDICGAAVVSRGPRTAGRVGRVQAIHHHHTVFEILCGIVLYIFRFKINTLLCYTIVLVLGIGIARGQYYWILDALFGIVLTLILGRVNQRDIDLYICTSNMQTRDMSNKLAAASRSHCLHFWTLRYGRISTSHCELNIA